MKKIILILAVVFTSILCKSQSLTILDTIQGSKHITYSWNIRACLEDSTIQMGVVKKIFVDDEELISENRIYYTRIHYQDMISIFVGLLPSVVTDIKEQVLEDFVNNK